MEEVTDSVDYEIWRACGGSTVRIPPVKSMVYYFPQGHAQHAFSLPAISGCPLAVPCRLDSVRLCANRDSDEVFAIFAMTPISSSHAISVNQEIDVMVHTVSYFKVLTKSDANNGGCFSVPRACAVSIFPPLNFDDDPPVQTLTVRDVHGSSWAFCHIYRGTPRRHLLTTGWNKFVDKKKLIAGDSVVFIKTTSGEIFIGIRRTTETSDWGKASQEWNTKLDGCRMMTKEANSSSSLCPGFWRQKGRVSAKAVEEAATLAANNCSFEVVYYPRGGGPEFCVGAKLVEEAMKVSWAVGMKVRMQVETEDSSKTSWCSGTITAVSTVDPLAWHDSPWKMLEVDPQISHFFRSFFFSKFISFFSSFTEFDFLSS